MDFLPIFLGFLAGLCYYICFEQRRMNKQFDMECWAKLHYMEKQNSSLRMVHIKSILVGILIVIFAMQGCKNVYRQILVFFGAAVIGLHTGQYINEMHYIKHKPHAGKNDNRNNMQ